MSSHGRWYLRGDPKKARLPTSESRPPCLRKPFRTFERSKAKEAQAREKQRTLRDLLSERYHDDRCGMETATYDAFGTVYGRILDDLAVLEHRHSHPCATEALSATCASTKRDSLPL